jgi:serine/threonine protein kinase
MESINIVRIKTLYNNRDLKEDIYQDSKEEKYPTNVGDWKVITQLQKSLFGYVYLIVKESIYATVKRSKLDQINQYATDNVNRECRTMKYIHNPNFHPNIVYLIDEFNDEYYHNIITPYYKGGDLFNYIKVHGPISISNCKRLFKQMVSTVIYLHEIKQVALMDISLENICITNSNINKADIIFIDLGAAIIHPNNNYHEYVSHMSMENNKKSLICKNITNRPGKSNYISPELYMFKPIDAYKNDIWSLGVCLFIMLTGSPPFEVACNDDPWYNVIIDGYWLIHSEIKKMPHLVHLFNNHFSILQLINAIFNPEDQRISLKDILDHPALV